LKLSFCGEMIRATIDCKEVAQVKSGFCPAGMAGIGSGWHNAQFDNFQIAVEEPPKNLAAGVPATSSSDWGPEFEAKYANDGNPATRWNAANAKADGEWLELDFGQPTAFNTVRVLQFEPRIAAYTIQVLEGNSWRDVFKGDMQSKADFTATFPECKGTKVRLEVNESINDDRSSRTPSVSEIEVFNVPDDT
jgi:hypothetical protein